MDEKEREDKSYELVRMTVEQAVKVVEEKGADGFHWYFLAAQEMLFNVTNSGDTSNNVLKYFPYASTFLAGMFFGVSNKDATIDIVKNMDQTEVYIANALAAFSLMSYNMLSDFIKSKEKMDLDKSEDNVV